MPKHIKAEFKFSVRIKGCDSVFAEGFEPGEISTQVVSYDRQTAEFFDGDFFHAVLEQKAREFMEEEVEVVITRVG